MDQDVYLENLDFQAAPSSASNVVKSSVGCDRERNRGRELHSQVNRGSRERHGEIER